MLALIPVAAIGLVGCRSTASSITGNWLSHFGPVGKSNRIVMFSLSNNNECLLMGERGTWSIRDERVTLRINKPSLFWTLLAKQEFPTRSETTLTFQLDTDRTRCDLVEVNGEEWTASPVTAFKEVK